MNKYHSLVLEKYNKFFETQLEAHKKVEDVDLSQIDQKMNEIERETNSVDEITDSIENVNSRIKEINDKILKDLENSITNFRNYISEEIEGISLDFSFMEVAKRGFMNDLNKLLNGLIQTLEESTNNPEKFKSFVENLSNEILLESLNIISKKIENYILFLDEKKENITKILQKLSSLMNKIEPHKIEKNKIFPSYGKIIKIEKEAQALSDSEIKKLLDNLEEDKKNEELSD